MMTGRKLLLLSLSCLASVAVIPTSASAAAVPAWDISSVALPTYFVPGKRALDFYEVTAANSGAGNTDGSPIALVDSLPPGLEVESIEMPIKPSPSGGEPALDGGSLFCTTQGNGGGETVTCTVPEEFAGSTTALVRPAEVLRLVIHVSVPAGTPEGPITNHVEVSGGGASGDTFESTNRITSASEPSTSPAGFSFYRSSILDEDGSPAERAGSHPDQFVTNFAVNTEATRPGAEAPFVPAQGDLKEITVELPPGMVGNPNAVTRCTPQQFNTSNLFHLPGREFFFNECPAGSAVGVIDLQQVEGKGQIAPQPIFNLVPPKGMPAQLGFDVLGAPLYIDTRVRTGSDYGITAYIPYTSNAKRVTAARVVLWGSPADASHDSIRGNCTGGAYEGFPFSLGDCPAGIAPKPFLRLPTSCTNGGSLGMAFDTWEQPGLFASAGSPLQASTGCGSLSFAPTISLAPTSSVAESPTGLHVDLHIPQSEDPNGLATPDLKDAVVKLPPGLTVNPSSAAGLQGCSPSQIGLTTPVGATPIHTTAAPAECPDAAKIGTVEIDTPLLDHPLPGAVYIASPYDNPFNSLLAIYIAVNDPESGVVVKLAGKVEIGAEGQLTTSFEENPQLPFEDFKLDFFDGPRAALKTGAVCGDFATISSLTPWSAPESGLPATPGDGFTVSSQPGGGTCPTSADQQPNHPSFEAGSESPLAGAYTPFVLRLTREDGTQQFSSLTVTPPPGLLGKLAGIPYCSDAALVGATYKSGKEEQASSSCPAASEVGIVNVGAGAGPSPFYVQGHAYLAGPYKGAPLSLAIITPAVAGPYDLGTVVVRSALEIDPFTSQITVKSDQIPTELKGIPLDVRSIAVKMNRSNFTLNPTSCEALAVGGSVATTVGQTATLHNGFQVGNCSKLAFKPKLNITLKGSTKRTGHPALKAVLTYPKTGAYANVARAQVNLPHSEFIEQNNLNKTCTKPVLLEGKCPAKSVYGKAKAWSPLLDKPLQGNVYLVGGFGFKLPALVAELDGQIRVLLAGKVDSGPNKGIRNTFEAVPDAPVEKFELNLKGGPKYSLLINSENLCKKPQKAIARFTAQNGKVLQTKPVIANSCKKKSQGGGKKSKGANKKKKASGSGGTKHKK